jgi:hypothetical protein
MRYCVGVLLLLVGSASAQSHFDGTWKMNMGTLEFSGPPEKYLIADGMYHCLSCEPPVHVKADGVDHKVASTRVLSVLHSRKMANLRPLQSRRYRRTGRK